MIQLDTEYKYCWAWRFLITWGGGEFSLSLYNSTRETPKFRITVV